MRNRQVQRNQDLSERIEHNFFFGFYVVFMIINIVFAVTGSSIAALNLLASISVGLSLWYFPSS